MAVIELPFSLPEDLSGHPGLTITATPDPLTASIALLVDGIHSSATYITITRNDPDGVSRVVRSAGGLVTGGATIAALTDYEAPLRDIVTYTVTPDFGYAVTSDPVVLETGWDEHWLKNAVQAAQNIRITVAEMSDVKRPARALATYSVLGRTNQVVISDIRGGRQGSMTLRTETANEAATLRGLLSTGQPLLFQAPAEMDFADLHFSPGDYSEERLTYGNSPYRHFTISWVEVDPPAGDVISGLNSYSMVALFGTYQHLLDQRDSYLDVLNLPWNEGDE